MSFNINEDNFEIDDSSKKSVPKKIIGEYSNNDALNRLREKVTRNAIDDEDINTSKENDTKETILNKCMAYVIDEDGVDTSIDEKPLYELQTVADILKEQSTKSLESLSKQYDIIFEDLTLQKQNSNPPAKTTLKAEIKSDDEENNNAEPNFKKIKNVQSNISFVISDIDSTTITPSNSMSDTATITFTPVSTDDSSKKINVSTNTKQIDLTNELVKLPQNINEDTEIPHSLEKTDFDEFVPENEITNEKDALKIKRKFALLRRNSFLATVISFFITILLSLGKIPFFSQLIVSAPKTSMIVCSAMAFIVIISNYKMFGSLKNIHNQNCEPDVLPAIASIISAALSVFAIINAFDILDILILLCFTLSIRAICSLFKALYMLSNIKFATSAQQKQALKLISDTAITNSLARNSIEGDALIATGHSFNKCNDIMKHLTFSKTLSGRLPIITIISLSLSLVIGFASAIYFDAFIYGLYAATIIQCFASLPCLFFIDTLPLFSSSRKLQKNSAAILGKKGAEEIELANAFVINSNDIFPKGTITLHKMQILSENNLDDTLIRAASLTEYTGNTLAPIFKSIAKSGNITVLPDADTVKYEERLGISGWVDNRLLFIGNRTLMETHGIKVPSIDVDRRILSNGYFPVYVATREKACALLIIQYSVEPNIARELRRITNIGVTMLVNNTDPNISEEMLCDYIGLYEDSVKVMSSVGSYMHKNATVKIDTASAPAVYKKNPIALPLILNCATKIKRSNLLLTMVYIICACLGAIVFAYTSFGGTSEPLSQTASLIYCLCSTVISYIIYLTERP